MREFAGVFRRLRAASDFAHGGKVTKTPPGTAPDEHFVLIVAFPRTPLRGTRTCWILQHFRRAKSEWLLSFHSGPLGPGFAKFKPNAVQQLRLTFRILVPVLYPSPVYCPGATVPPGQAQKRNRIRCKFWSVRPPVGPGSNLDFTQVLRAGRFLPTPRGDPRK